MSARHWKLHAGRLVAGLIGVLLLGIVSGHPLAVLLTGSSLYLAWILFNSFRLFAWLQKGQGSPPESMGIWADICDRINKALGAKPGAPLAAK